MTRTVYAVFGLAAGLLALSAGPASALHIRLMAVGTSATGQVQANPAEGVTSGTPAVAELGDPLILFGEVTDDTASGTTFTHTFNFGFDAPGTGAASAIPNFLPIGTSFLAGFAEFEGSVTGPGISGSLPLTRIGTPTTPRSQVIATSFAAVDTGTTTPYTLTITGRLLDGVTAGNYTGNIGVVPLPGAAVLFLTGLGGLLAFARRYRRRDGEDGGATVVGAVAAA